MSDAILLVDDEPHLLLATSHRLRASGYEVATARGGFEALAVAKRTPFDLVILDVGMPELDGLETFTRLRALPAYADVPVVFLTAKIQPEIRGRAMDEGARFFLQKPIDSAILLEAIQEALAERMASVQA